MSLFIIVMATGTFNSNLLILFIGNKGMSFILPSLLYIDFSSYSTSEVSPFIEMLLFF